MLQDIRLPIQDIVAEHSHKLRNVAVADILSIKGKCGLHRLAIFLLESDIRCRQTYTHGLTLSAPWMEHALENAATSDPGLLTIIDNPLLANQ